jgi:hypothetical protein
MKIKIKESGNRVFLSYGNIFLRKNQIKEVEDSKELQDLLLKGYVELVDDSAKKVPSKKGRKKNSRVINSDSKKMRID